MFSKEQIREAMLDKRINLSQEEVLKSSQSCASQLFSLNEYKEAKTIYIYAAFRNEIDTKMIIEDALSQSKQVGLPISYPEGHMEFYEVFDLSDLQKGRYGILEPRPDILLQSQDALMIVPGVAFDIRKHRIGYGGGYYDRYCNIHPDLYKIGLSYDFQIIDAIAMEKHDQGVDLVITPSQMIL